VAIREDEKAAEAMGVNVFGLKLFAFAVAPSSPAWPGRSRRTRTPCPSPDQYIFLESAFLLAAVVLGGMGTVAGVLVGATILKLLPEKLRFFSEYRLLIFGLLLVVMMRFRPEGLVASKRRQLEFHEDDEALANEIQQDHLSRSCTRRDGMTVIAAPDVQDGGPAAAGAKVLEARGVVMRFGGLVAVNNVDFDVHEGEIVGLIGPNGAGKTTFFNCLTGMYKPTSGTVRPLRGGLPPKPRAVVKAGMARTFQNIRLFGNMTALENVMVGRYCRTSSGPHLDPARPEVPPRGGRVPGSRPGVAGLRRSRESPPSTSPAICPMAISAAWRSRGRWRPTPSSSCWTSRRPA
jgi:hypothetical protein